MAFIKLISLITKFLVRRMRNLTKIGASDHDVQLDSGPLEGFPDVVLKKIFENLRIRDRARMRQVSKTWNRILCQVDVPEAPWLLEPNINYSSLLTRMTFLSFGGRKRYSFKLPKIYRGLRGGWFCGSSRGWVLLATGPNSNPLLFLWNPLLGITKQLPSPSKLPFVDELQDSVWGSNRVGNGNHFSSFVKRVEIFQVGSQASIVAAIFSNPSLGDQGDRLALCTPQEKTWTVLEVDHLYVYEDLLFHKGKLYVLSKYVDDDGVELGTEDSREEEEVDEYEDEEVEDQEVGDEDGNEDVVEENGDEDEDEDRGEDVVEEDEEGTEEEEDEEDAEEDGEEYTIQLSRRSSNCAVKVRMLCLENYKPSNPKLVVYKEEEEEPTFNLTCLDRFVGHLVESSTAGHQLLVVTTIFDSYRYNTHGEMGPDDKTFQCDQTREFEVRTARGSKSTRRRLLIGKQTIYIGSGTGSFSRPADARTNIRANRIYFMTDDARGLVGKKDQYLGRESGGFLYRQRIRRTESMRLVPADHHPKTGWFMPKLV